MILSTKVVHCSAPLEGMGSEVVDILRAVLVLAYCFVATQYIIAGQFLISEDALVRFDIG